MSTPSAPSYHAFLSYSHKDRALAMKLHTWLTRDAGFRIWFDENHLEAGSPVAARLAEQMGKCQNWIVLASRNSVASDWVIAERDQALHMAAESRGRFHLIVLRVDDCPLAQAWPSVSRFNWLDMNAGVLSAQLARDIIDRLDGRTWSGRPTATRDVFVSRGWRTSDAAFGDAVCQALCVRRWLLRLIGDAPDQEQFSPDRIREIMSACSGHLVILPRRGEGDAPTEKDYRYLIRELAISADLGIPSLLLAEASTPLPQTLHAKAVRLRPQSHYADEWAAEAPEWLDDFLDDLRAPPAPQHLFLAAEFKENLERVARLREFMESQTGLRCQIGRDFEGQGLRDQIVQGLATASVVLANLASFAPGSMASIQSVNVNTCVEAGMALGASAARSNAGQKPLPVFLTVQSAPDVSDRTRVLPFMFRDSQITWYADEAELLAHCRRLLFPFRRRIMNYEFTKPV